MQLPARAGGVQLPARGLKKSECTLREMPLPMLVVCDACSCASLQTRACVLVLAQQQAAV